jgi:hypothetical protein
MVNTTPTIIPTTEPTIDLYNGGLAPPELSAFLFFMIIGTIIAIWFIWLIMERGAN